MILNTENSSCMHTMNKFSQTIRKSNDLIEARYRLGLNEQRLVLLLASEINADDNEFKDYIVRITDFAHMFALESDNAIYSKVEQAADALLGKVIILKNNQEIEKTVWLSYVNYVKGSGIVKVRFDKSLKPYLLQLKDYGNYTQYKLNYVINFKSQYSIRLYELLKMEAFKAKNNKFRKDFDLKDLRSILGIDKKEYKIFNNFRVRVVEPAIREVSNQTDLEIEDINYLRERNKVVQIIFFVKIRSPEQKLLLSNQTEQEITKQPDALIERMVSLGFAIETAKKYKTKYGVKRIERNIAYALAKKQAGLVKDLPAYLNLAISEDMGGAWEVAKVQQAQDKQQEHLRLAALDAQAEKAHAAVIQQLLGDKPVESTKIKPNTVKVRDLKRLLDD